MLPCVFWKRRTSLARSAFPALLINLLLFSLEEARLDQSHLARHVEGVLAHGRGLYAPRRATSASASARQARLALT